MLALFHTSPEPITSIRRDGPLGECLCFSSNVYQMAACEVLVYSINIDESDVIEASSYFYRDDAELLTPLVEEIMELLGCDEALAQEHLSQVAPFCGDAEADWRVQGYAGEAARMLGYRACRADDEQGTVFIVPMHEREAELRLVEA